MAQSVFGKAFEVVEIKGGKYFYHFFVDENQFKNWRADHRNLNVIPAIGTAGQIKASRAPHSMDVDHSLDFEYMD